MRLFLLLLVSFFLSSCSVEKKSEEYFFHRSEEIKEQLFTELSEVQTLPDLFVKQNTLTSLFNQLARLSIEARAYQKLCKKEFSMSQTAKMTSQRLSDEYARVLCIPGARAFMEKCQATGLDIIDAAAERPKKKDLSR